MSLIQLPQHILQAVITETVNISTPDQAFSLRLVCKQFDKEVLHAAFEKDDNTLFGCIIDRKIQILSNVGRFRCLRGFIIRRNHSDCQTKVWRQLTSAVETLCNQKPNALDPDCKYSKTPSPDRFLSMYPGDSRTCSREAAIAMVCDAVLAFLGNDFDAVDLLMSSFDISHLLWANLEKKTADFWLLTVAARRNDFNLFSTTLETFRAYKNDLSTRVWVDNMGDALRIPAKQGLTPMLKLILDQEDVEPKHITRKGRHRAYNSFEIAAKASHLDSVEFFLSRGVDLLQDHTNYSRALRLAISYATDSVKRSRFLEIFMSMTEGWRSLEITAGIIETLCGHGDLDAVKTVVKKYESMTDNQQHHTWHWTLYYHADQILKQATRSHDPAIVRYVIECRKRLPSLMDESFSEHRILDCIETAIEEKKPEVIHELFQQELPEVVMKEKLFTYAAAVSDMATLEMLSKDVDPNKKFDENSPYWDFGANNSRLAFKMTQLKSEHTSYLTECDLLSLGTISLLVAIKAANLETTKWLLERGQRLGRRLFECTSFLYSTTSCLIMEDESLIGGKGRVIALAPRPRYPLSVKATLEDGGAVTRNTLIITHGRGQHEIDKLIASGKKYTKFNKFLDRFRVKFQLSKFLRDAGVRVVLEIEVPSWPYDDEECTSDCWKKRNLCKYHQMATLLYKHRHADIYQELWN